MAGYVSELTTFLQALQREHPDLEHKQREARALWWDRENASPMLQDPEEMRRWRAARARIAPYVYYTYGPVKPEADS